MMQEISDRVFQVGAPDPRLPYFDALMPTPYGTTYNSYLVRGDEKKALIDPVQGDKADQLLQNLKELKADKLDYIICLHTEQDHAGAILVLRDVFPDAQIVGTAKVAELMEYHFHIPRETFLIVAEGDSIDLGGVTLECMPIPFAHWPDNTMFWKMCIRDRNWRPWPDMICAGVSAIGQTTIGSIQELAGVEPDYSLEDGNIRCVVEYSDDDEQSKVIAALMASTRIGCLQLEDSYGKKFVTVNDVFHGDTET